MSFKNVIFALSIFSCPLSVVKASIFPDAPPKKTNAIQMCLCNKANKSRAALFSRQIPEYRDSIFRRKQK